ncbi:FkbM family methyltransferase [Tropicibacter naphthalenivorans]|uniref:Methyltransferase, FkbM family n=1 Tax=Tropicibacter naphthalenivorans TaxID=441103 RepID=A0A0P1GK59_9RHOB|nr:FkbM family methyltransferase [Tropicibacter naphthalenivorans]CUH82003.1 methyltransferase, FkbM family [Tropicibacter naphthalenivorans]SMD07725.1 methyltransferase, FkbM family [Tropicibacter naphthalenivorans]
MAALHPQEPDLILDLGMHEGRDTEYYLAKGFRVVAVEANTELAEKVGNTLKEHQESGALTIVNAAIADGEGEMTFYVNDHNPNFSSTDPTIAAKGQALREITVPRVNIADVVRRHGRPFYVKIDLEGADGTALDHLGQLPDLLHPSYISVEGLSDQNFRSLTRMGYNQFQFVNQRYHPNTREPFPALAGKFLNHKFKNSSSGMFGPELSGRWLDFPEAVRQRDRIMSYRERVRQEFKESPEAFPEGLPLFGWFDIHARRSN